MLTFCSRYISSRTEKLLSIATFVILLFSTLQSYYFYNINLAPFPIIGVIIYFFITSFLFFMNSRYMKLSIINSFNITFTHLNLSLYLLILICVSVFISFGNSNLYTYENSIFGFFIGVYVYIIMNIYKMNYLSFIKVLKCVILFHISVSLFQSFVYYLSGYYIDFLYSVTGEVQRYKYPVLNPLIRATGLFNEPATYAFYILSLGSLLLNIKEKTKSDHALIILSIFTSFISFSSMAFIGSFILSVLYISMLKNLRKLFVNFVLNIPIILLIFIAFYDLISHAFTVVVSRIFSFSTDASAMIRITAGLESFYRDSDFFEFIFGSGIGNHTHSDGAGMLISYLIVYFGLLGTIVILFLIFYVLKNFTQSIFFIFILLNPPSIQQLFFWIWLTFASSRYFNSNVKLEKNNVLIKNYNV